MRIGLIAPPWLPVPPPRYGGTEAVIDNLARGLRDLGHDVVLFTVGESTCPVPRRHLYEQAPSRIGDSAHEAAHVLAAYQAFRDVDIVHDHTILGPLIAAGLDDRIPPIAVTHHGPFDAPARRIFGRVSRHASVVAISHAHARSAGNVPIAAVIHHGLDLDVYRPGPGDGGYLLFMGRMSPDKGVHRAVRIAREADQPLVIVAKMREPEEIAYYRSVVRPLMPAGAEPPREEPRQQRIELLRAATGLLNPINWPEPFGLVMAESLATATPVVATPYGAAPEIVDSGSTGFLATDDTHLVADVGRLGSIDRRRCRRAAERRFSLARMARDYERLYRRIQSARSRPVKRLAG
jgi:glycosyltransferase involved in cell wall biosynthesis